MTAKIKMSKDTEAVCESIAKGYDRRKREYNSRRKNIIYEGGGFDYSNHIGSAGSAKGTHIADPSARKAERLEALENSLDVKFLRAVEQSLAMSGSDVADDSRTRLHNALLLNCESGRSYPYELLNIDEFSRRDFYRRRKRFIRGIGVILGLAESE
jgi:hypothetical protein